MVEALVLGMVAQSSLLLSGLLVAVRAGDGQRRSAQLTNREEQVLRLIADGHATREVAA